MALINCKECGHEVSSSANKCPNCGIKLKSGIGFFGWTFIVIGIFVFIAILGSIAPRDNNKSQNNISSTAQKETAKGSLIKYETLRQSNIPAGGVSMDILVSEDATKEEVLSLAKYFRSTCLPDHFILVNIFDLREAYLHRDDPNYPEEKYGKHWLVEMHRNPKTGSDEINWVGEGRDH